MKRGHACSRSHNKIWTAVTCLWQKIGSRYDPTTLAQKYFIRNSLKRKLVRPIMAWRPFWKRGNENQAVSCVATNLGTLHQRPSCSEVFDQELFEEEGSEAYHGEAAGVHLNVVHVLELKAVWV